MGHVSAMLGRKHSDETKAIISAHNKGKRCGSKHTEETKAKIRLARAGQIVWNKGRTYTEEDKQKMNLTGLLKGRGWNKGLPYLAGEKHWNWKGGVTPDHTKIRMSLEYKEWRRAVFQRDRFTCSSCGAKSYEGQKVTLNADHIKPFAHYPELRFSLDNGRTLCLECHKGTSTYGAKGRSLINSVLQK